MEYYGGAFINVRGKLGKLFGFSLEGNTYELHVFNKSSKTGLGLITYLTALLSG